MKKINIGVLGVSNHLLKRIILPLNNISNGCIYAIASRNEDNAAQFAKKFNIPKFYGSYEALLNDPVINAVYIPLPNHLHLKWIKEAALKGKHIICEKPITLNEDEAKQALTYANNNKVLLQEAFMYKFHPQWIHALNLIRTNQLGQVKYIRTSFAYNNPNPNNIRNIKEFGGGAIMDIGCYAISLSRYILQQEPSQVMALMQHHESFKTDTLSTAILDFNGIHSLFTVSTLTEANQSVEIVATDGIINIHIPFNTYVDTKSKITISTAQGSRDVEFNVCDQYGLMFENFCSKIIENETENTEVKDAINNMKVIDALFKSSETKSWVQI
ncbi:Gfo/Idh/MocA family protein [Plebeiibacterium sediminum]|uniref:Gfo/Idh/MocA family oxidoreductase n=1 Tax=Plebeiibacterium sediminum TaxID=2992112 RepID=A0AAE3M1K7_9BACT|nr:Gfo/Idh/MocA family oxidoreductase [Plebeiobacterium sediminum]MCW3785120.1 Gfo/Idh/MocA family oxidoreductase [Plebeiobacterium sediminum]